MRKHLEAGMEARMSSESAVWKAMGEVPLFESDLFQSITKVNTLKKILAARCWGT